MEVEPFGYLHVLERSLSTAPSARSVAVKTAGSQPMVVRGVRAIN